MLSFLKNWTLPISMLTGVLVYLVFHCVDFMVPLRPAAWAVEKILTPSFIFVQLFITFCKVNPHEFRLRAWHVWFLILQGLGSVAAYLILASFSPVVAQGAMVCLICPTATAAAVITAKLGGSAEALITYTLMINILAAIFVPLVFPLVYLQEGLSFLEAFLLILSKVVPLLIFPFLVAQLLRLVWRRAHDWFRDHAGMAFYIWACALALVMGKTAKSIVDDSGNLPALFALCTISLVVCCLQFGVGKAIGTHYGERISGGQALGQKNTVLAIWMAITYLHPLSAVAPGAYVLWQNIINSYQLWKKRKREAV